MKKAEYCDSAFVSDQNFYVLNYIPGGIALGTTFSIGGIVFR